MDAFPVEQGAPTRAISSQIADLEQRVAGLSDELTRAAPLAEIGLSTAALVHELSNVLTPVLGAASLARRFPSDAACVEKCLERIERSAARAQRLCRSLLAAAGSPPAPGRADLAAFLVELRDEASLTAAESGVTLRITSPPEMPGGGGTLGIPRDELLQIGNNLVFNAVRALARHGGPRALFVTSEWSDASCTLRFTDTGPGIATPMLSGLFQPCASDQVGGHGLGLWLSRRLAQKWGGSLDLEATSDVGTTFRLTVPRSA